MRTIIYAVFNKDTNERVYTNADLHKCEEHMKGLKGNFEIRHKWKSF